MTGSKEVVSQFLEDYERLGERLSRNLRDYLGEPGRTQTHSLRAAVRRLDAAVQVLPKRTKKEKDFKRWRQRCKKLLKETTRTRDIDILSDRISALPTNETFGLLLKNLAEERGAFVGNATKAAWRLFEHHPPKLSKQDLPRLLRRTDTVLRALDRQITDALLVSLRDEARADDLHRMRKHCKRLRYTLELFPSVPKQAHLVRVLRTWQDVLGEIRDSDVMIEYLSRAKPTPAVSQALSSERAHRHSRYVSFVRMAAQLQREGSFSILGAGEASSPVTR